MMSRARAEIILPSEVEAEPRQQHFAQDPAVAEQQVEAEPRLQHRAPAPPVAEPRQAALTLAAKARPTLVPRHSQVLPARPEPPVPPPPPPPGPPHPPPGVPQPVARRLVVLTMGLRFVGEGHFRAQSAGGVHYLTKLQHEVDTPPLPAERTVLDALQAANCTNNARGSIAVDCRMFPDPDHHNRPRDSVNHLGFSPTIILGVVRHRNFMEWLRDVKRRVLQEEITMNRHGDMLALCTYCKSGRHRSVACAVIMEYILSNLGYTVTTATHLAGHRWQRRTCNHCHECRAPSPARDEALAFALRICRLLV